MIKHMTEAAERASTELRRSLQDWMRSQIARGYAARAVRDAVEGQGDAIRRERQGQALTELARLGQEWDAAPEAGE